MLAILNDAILGKILLWIIMLGAACYMVWRVYEAITDPYGYGKDLIGLSKRSGIALSTIADLLIVYAAIRILLGVGGIQQSGEPQEEREFVSKMLTEGWGACAVTSIGIVVMIAAVVQFVYGVSGGYKERLDIGHYRKAGKAIIHFLAWTGYCSRGIIVGIIGFFFIKAAIMGASKHVVNTDKAFDFIGDELGHGFYILVAAGTVCYGIFMIINGIAYDQDKD